MSNIRLNYFTEDTLIGKHRSLVICLLLLLVIFVVYWQVTRHGFVSFDDDVYVTENGYVQEGFSNDAILWAFSFHHETGSTYWHPLTWLSHMLDYQLFGLNAGRHHLTNLIFHIINTLLLFLLLKRVTGTLWRSAIVAAFFAIHPVNVDSVAWIAERKNLLSTMFWLLTLICYSLYAERPRILLYILTSVMFVLGLLAKPMLATLPFVLLLLDYWPLQRFPFILPDRRQNHSVTFKKSSPAILVVEKVPFMVLSLVAIYISSLELKTGGHLISYSARPLGLRLANFLDSYISYIRNFFWPTDLSILYPYPTEMVPVGSIAVAVLVLLILTVIALGQIRKRPFIFTGLFWFFGTLIPVSGIIQGGVWPAMADRWAYVPFIGLYILVTWGISSILPDTRLFKPLKAGVAVTIILVLAVMAWIQAGYWKNDITLFSHAVKVTENNYIAHNNLGRALENARNYRDSIYHYSEAFRIKPENLEIGNNLGVALAKAGRTEEAISQFEKILEKDPHNERALINLGTAYSESGEFKKAEENLRKALKLCGGSADVYFSLGVMLARQGRNQEAAEQYLQALAINPRHINARVNLANSFVRLGKLDDAIIHYSEVLRIDPRHETAKHNLQLLQSQRRDLDERIKDLRVAVDKNPESPNLLYNLALANQKRGHIESALMFYEKALSINSALTEAHRNMALIYSQKGNYEKSMEELKKVIELEPDNPDAYYNMACLYSKKNDIETSLQWLKMAVEKGFRNRELLKNDPDLNNIMDTEYFKGLIR